MLVDLPHWSLQNAPRSSSGIAEWTRTPGRDWSGCWLSPRPQRSVKHRRSLPSMELALVHVPRGRRPKSRATRPTNENTRGPRSQGDSARRPGARRPPPWRRRGLGPRGRARELRRRAGAHNSSGKHEGDKTLRLLGALQQDPASFRSGIRRDKMFDD